MNAVSRFDANRRKHARGIQRLPAWAPAAVYAAGAVVAAVFLFQFFFRYQYFQNNGVLWRIDRFTQQMCRYNAAQGSCLIPKASSSVSTSTSTSTSVSLKVPSKNHKH